MQSAFGKHVKRNNEGYGSDGIDASEDEDHMCNDASLDEPEDTDEVEHGSLQRTSALHPAFKRSQRKSQHRSGSDEDEHLHGAHVLPSAKRQSQRGGTHRRSNTSLEEELPNKKDTALVDSPEKKDAVPLHGECERHTNGGRKNANVDASSNWFDHKSSEHFTRCENDAPAGDARLGDRTSAQIDGHRSPTVETLGERRRGCTTGEQNAAPDAGSGGDDLEEGDDGDGGNFEEDDDEEDHDLDWEDEGEELYDDDFDDGGLRVNLRRATRAYRTGDLREESDDDEYRSDDEQFGRVSNRCI